jgi:hypothetical protein
MPDRDFLDELVGKRAARNPDTPAMVESYHDRRLKDDLEFREEFERHRQEIVAGQDRPRRGDRG